MVVGIQFKTLSGCKNNFSSSLSTLTSFGWVTRTIIHKFTTTTSTKTKNHIDNGATVSNAAFTRHKIHIASILQRNPITFSKQSQFESAYRLYREHNIQEEYSRAIFSIDDNLPPIKNSVVINEIDKEEDGAVRDDDLQNINRLADRKLYFMIRGGGALNDDGTLRNDDHWTFPYMESRCENIPIHTQAHNHLQSLLVKQEKEQEGEKHQPLLTVGRSPIAYWLEEWPDRLKAPLGTKWFFIKHQVIDGDLLWDGEAWSRLMGGGDRFVGVWLCKEEVENVVSASLWANIKHTLSH